jgi:hypothetical protein
VVDSLVLSCELNTLNMDRTYVIELEIIFERRTADIADFAPDWHFYRLFFQNRGLKLMSNRRHIGTMFRHHVLVGLVR